ncbi:T9SS type B sorting domain-containing protein [uncultured Polaribacter sp.]|uniref:T9SS type B sorting domain-containing protein n=1 Tax=uncultured Polaribacter sp. TaxID=174711 RepID=UPI00263006D4|nr:T9SS type B sorting domain-containing protein [uncultured Polaribacter sp.]
MKKLLHHSKWLLLLLIVQTVSLEFYAQTKSETSTSAKNVPFTQRLVNGGVNLKGDISFIANNIVSKDQGGTVPNDNYNGTSEGNNKLNLNYIDIDGDATTFSSSKAQLNLPNCSKVVHAGLYWTAVYPYRYWDTKEARSSDFNKIKFKLPGGNYQDIIGDIIFDGQTSTEAEKVVYTCYKDITSIVSALGDSNGDYYAANIRATVRGTSNTGSSGGWIMVVVYENQTEPSRRVSIFDGFASVQGGSNPKSAEVSYSGFNTIPVGPVKARMLVAALEGDYNLKGDQFKMEDVNGAYQDLFTPNLNAATNFFNGSITIDDTFQVGRVPSSQNTLGFDADLFTVNNVNNKLIANDQTSAKVQMTSKGDGYWVFLNAMSIDIIEPNIELIKTIDNGEGVDIGGKNVDLGDLIWYNVSFRNKGNDDALGAVLIDRLPKNVDFLESELILPPGVKYTYEPPVLANEFRGVLRFTIPNGLVEKGDPAYTIRIKTKVVENCNELRDVCSNKIENQVITSYTGKTSGISINEDPSFYGVDACNIGLEGPSNFLVDVDGCKYERDEILCAATVTLTAGSGFLSYEWKNENGVVIGNSQSVTVSSTGRYTVDKIAPVGCISTSEIVNVKSFITQENPLLAYADEIKTCPNDGSKLSEIYLCGDGSIKEIKTTIFNSNTILWQKLDETSCGAVTNSDCANVDNACTWNTVKTENDFTADAPGQYRLEIRSQGGCFKRFYFNVFKATIDPAVITKDIICGTPGSITINNVPVDYEYSLTNNVGSYQDRNVFDVTSAGSYNVFIRKKGGSITSCIYSLVNIDIVEKDIDVKLITQPISCSDSTGEIRVQVDNIAGDYTYKLYKDGNLLSTVGPIADNDYSFDVSQAGFYSVEVTASNSCNFIGEVTFTKPSPLDLSATATKSINCLDGSIELNPSGGVPIYNFAIWSYNGTNLYSDADAIPVSDFFTSSTIAIPLGKEGIYEYLVMDANNCWTISNPVTISKEDDLAFNETVNNSTCYGENSGSINVSIQGSNLGYSLTYSIDNGVTYQGNGIFNNLAPDTYVIKINAAKAGETCTYERSILVTEPTEIVGSASLTQDYTCTTDGIITFDMPSGGKAPYKFSIDNSNYVTNSTFNNLGSGIYTVSIKDANNCVLNLPNITINPLPTAPNGTANVVYACDGKGTITILPTNALYTYSFNGGAFSSNTIFTNISEGSYPIEINYGSNCTETIVVEVLPNNTFKGTVSSVSDATCNGNSDGSITINAENFGSNFEYAVNGGSWVAATSSPIILNTLPQGNYAIQLKKDTCILDLDTQIISEPSVVTVTATITKNLSCGSSDATITPSAAGGKAPYEFSIDNGTTWQTQFTNLSSGIYTIKARDTNGCLATTDAVIQINTPVTLQHTATSAQCYTGNNGEISVNVTQGNGDYTFRINNGLWFSPDVATPNAYIFKNLVPNTYTINVKDALGCESVISNHTIYPQLNASILTTDISCTSGAISVTASGGNGAYVYAFVDAGVLPTNADFGNTNNKTISIAGNYDVYVRDRSGNTGFCEFIKTVTIHKTPDLNVIATATDPKCFGEKGKIEIAISGSKAPYSIEVNGSNGYTNTTVFFYGTLKEYVNLSAGNYTIEVTGADGCSKTTNAAVIEPLDLEANIKPIVPDCTITDPTQFGFEFEVTNSYAPYILNYSSDNGANWSTNPVFLNNPSGTKVFPVIRLLETDGVTVRCEKVLDPYTIPYPVSNLVVSTAPGGSCVDGFNVTVEAQDGVAPYQFAINSTTDWQTPIPSTSLQYIFDNLTPGLNYTFYVKDATGCIKQNDTNVYDTFTPDIAITGNVTKDACATSDTGEIEFSIDDAKNPLSGILNWNVFDKTTNTIISNGSQSNTNNITVSNLAAGDYYLVLTNGASCSWGSLDVSVKRGLEITGVAVVAKDITCALPGIIEISSIYGGFGNYEFTLSSSNFVSTIVTTDLFIEVPLSNLVDPTISSTVLISVKDASECNKVLNSVTLNVSEKPTISTLTANSCDSNKTITVIGANGLAPYFYSIDNGVSYVSTSVFENLTPGDYQVKIKDSNACESPAETVKIIPELDFIGTVTKNLDCSSSPNAEITLTVTSGSGDYDYEVSDGLGNIVFSRTNLLNNPEIISVSNVTSYHITVFDNALATGSCFKTIEVEIPERLLPDFTYTVTNSVCSGSNSGNISFQNLNSSLTYTYSISPVSGTFDTSSNSFIDVAPGTYTITALSSNGCNVDKTNVNILEFNPILVPTPTVTEFNCLVGNSGENASISIDKTAISGGSGSYTIFEFIDTKGTVATTDDEVVQKGNTSTYYSTNKNGGAYRINVYDSLGCMGSTNAIIQPFSEITGASITIDKALDCATGEHISINYTSTLPIANISYAVVGKNGFSETNNTGEFFNLTEDVYTVTVNNLTTGCSLQRTHQVLEITPFKLTVNKVNDVSCFGANTGEVTLDFSTTTPYSDAYNYEIFDNNSGITTSISGTGTGVTSINNLPAGAYYTVVNMSNTPFCEVTSEVFTIENPMNPLDFFFVETPINCLVANSGEILINAKGGWGDYQYKVTTTSGTIIQDFSNNNSIINLSSDAYNVIVKDKNGCEVLKNSVLEAPTPIQATLVETVLNSCAGEASAAIQVAVSSGGQGNPPNYFYQIQLDGQTISAKQSSNIFTDLAAGNYTVTISDDYSCDLQLPITINEPNKVIIEANITSSVSCLTETASVTVSANGGAGNYTYSSDGINFGNNSTFNLTPGDYQFYAKDANGCTSETSAIINILPVTPLSATLNLDVALVSCANENTAVLSANASGGLGNYFYELLEDTNVVVRPQQTSEIFDNLGSGTYKIRVTSEDCEITTATHTIVDPVPLEFTAPIAVTNITCLGSNDGSITINAQGGTGNLIYSIDQLKFETSNTFSNLSAGNYDVIVQDESGCFILQTVTIMQPTALTATAINVKQETCFGNADASFSVAIVGGTAPYKTKLNGGVFIDNQVAFSNLTGGKTHVVFVEDSQGCETVVIVNLEEAVDLNLQSTTAVDCTNYLTTISATIDAAYANEVTFSLDGSTPQTNGEFKDIASGNYTLTVTHENGCIVTEEIVINNPEPLIFNGPVIKTDVSCFGENNGTITINAQGGTGNLMYSIDQLNFETSNTFSNLSAGNYNITVQDESGCSILQTVTIMQPTALTATAINVNQETCFGNADASFFINIVGGTAPYKTKLNDGVFIDNQVAFSNLTGETTHVVFVEDSQGCKTVVTVNLEEAVDLNLQSTTTVNCTNYLTTISATVDAAYASEVTFSLDGNTPQIDGEFKDIASGSHTLTVTHTNGCIVTEEIVINNPEPLIFDGPVIATAISCFGESNGTITINAKGGQGDFLCSIDGVNFKSQSVFTNLASGVYEVSVKDNLNCEPITQKITIAEPSELKVALKNIVEETCVGNSNASFELDISGDEAPYETKLENGAFVTGQTLFSNLEGGKTYAVTVKGKNGCEKSIDVSLKTAVNLNVSANVSYTCEEGASIVAAVSSAYQNQITYTLNDTSPTTDGKYSNVLPGKYRVKAVHENGCSVSTEIEVEKSVPLELTIDTNTKNTLIADPIGGSSPYTYSLNGGDFDWDNTFIINATRTYTITVKDAKGCEVSAAVEGVYIDIFIPNFFTPNNNNENDFWYPERVEEYHEIEVSVYDRYSRLLKEFKGIQQGWDGIYNGKPMPSGDYWYVVYYKDILGDKKKLIGNFTLYR